MNGKSTLWVQPEAPVNLDRSLVPWCVCLQRVFLHYTKDSTLTFIDEKPVSYNHVMKFTLNGGYKALSGFLRLSSALWSIMIPKGSLLVIGITIWWINTLNEIRSKNKAEKRKVFGLFVFLKLFIASVDFNKLINMLRPRRNLNYSKLHFLDQSGAVWPDWAIYERSRQQILIIKCSPNIWQLLGLFWKCHFLSIIRYGVFYAVH